MKYISGDFAQSLIPRLGILQELTLSHSDWSVKNDSLFGDHMCSYQIITD